MKPLSDQQRDTLPFNALGGIIGGSAYLWVPLPWTFVYAAAAFAAIFWAQDRMRVRRNQRDTYRRSLVALTRRCEEDQTRAYFVDLVPADVLTEAIPEEAPRG